MGIQNSKPQVINANNLVQSKSEENNSTFDQEVLKLFQQNSQNGILYKDKFNESLEIIEKFGCKRLRDTPLGLRLYHVFDQDKSGKLDFKEFKLGLNVLITNQEKRIQLTFMAYDIDGDNYIHKQEFIDFMIQSWKAAFKILAYQVKQQKQSTINNQFDV